MSIENNRFALLISEKLQTCSDIEILKKSHTQPNKINSCLHEMLCFNLRLHMDGNQPELTYKNRHAQDSRSCETWIFKCVGSMTLEDSSTLAVAVPGLTLELETKVRSLPVCEDEGRKEKGEDGSTYLWSTCY
jgi:hypothetical protein